MTAPLPSAPATPPRLKAVMPLLASQDRKPAPARTVGNQLTSKVHSEQTAADEHHSAIVSRRNSGAKSDEIGTRGACLSFERREIVRGFRQ
jgi:hypothetical protein